jgi:hypothetical protein
MREMQVHNEEHKEYSNINDVILANKRHGELFFDKSGYKNFSMRVHDKVYYGCMFVTSEKSKYNSNPRYNRRTYTARLIDENGAVWSVGEPLTHLNARQAINDIHAYAQFMGWK